MNQKALRERRFREMLCRSRKFCAGQPTAFKIYGKTTYTEKVSTNGCDDSS